MRTPRPLVVVLVAVVGIVCLGAQQPAVANIKPGRLGIGDSVLLGAKSELQAHGFGVVDAVVSRQYYAAPSRVGYWRRQGKLPKNVVIHLGNNGIVLLSDCYHAVQAARHRRVFLVTLKVPRSWRIQDNKTLHRCARHFGRAYLVDWYAESHDHPGWFAKDGYHLTGTGARAYADLIGRRIAAVG
jgi:hypothetical protein